MPPRNVRRRGEKVSRRARGILVTERIEFANRRLQCDTAGTQHEADLDRRLDRLMALVPTHPAGGKLQTVVGRFAATSSSSSKIVISRRPTTARSGRCAPVRSTARSPTASAAHGALPSTQTSGRSSKPRAEDQSGPPTPSASPSTKGRCRSAHRSRHHHPLAIGNVITQSRAVETSAPVSDADRMGRSWPAHRRPKPARTSLL